jgi:hypothetical protein
MNCRRLTIADRAFLLSRSDNKLAALYEAKLIRLADLQLIFNAAVENDNPPGPGIVGGKERTE